MRSVIGGRERSALGWTHEVLPCSPSSAPRSRNADVAGSRIRRNAPITQCDGRPRASRALGNRRSQASQALARDEAFARRSDATLLEVRRRERVWPCLSGACPGAMGRSPSGGESRLEVGEAGCVRARLALPMAGRELKQLFRAYREGDELAFRRAAQEIIEEEEAKHHLALARDLRRIITGGANIAFSEGVTLPPPPMDREGEWPLAEVRHPSRALGDLVLSASAATRIASLANEVRHWDDLDRHGVPRRQRLLLYGPPGCGKSSVAEGLAAELGLPLMVVRLDSVVSSYLGETASNLHRIFDYARSGSWVLFFDEFDALGRARDDPTEHGEIKRVITAFLQMLDGFRGPSLLVAATNHEGLLDPALWRRFDEVLELGPPTVHQVRKLLRLRLRPVRHSGVDIERAARALKGLPHAAAEKAVWDARRSAILAGRDFVTHGDVEIAIADARSRPW